MTRKTAAKKETGEPANELAVDPEQLWQTADSLRGSIDAAEYKHVVLGLIFLKYISDAFEARRNVLAEELASDGIEGEQADQLLESRDEYTAEGVFWVPTDARWGFIQSHAKSGFTDPETGRKKTTAVMIDDAMHAIENDNAKLKGKLPRDYARRGIATERLGKLIDQIGSIAIGTKQAQAKDILGRVYEYFLGKFAAAEGKLGGEFFTPSSVVRLLVEMIEPYEGRVYDPACGSGGMFVQSERFAEVHGGSRRDISIFGQESNPTTWRLAHMNLAIRGIEANLGEQPSDSFVRDLHPDLKADYILAGFVMANGSLSSSSGGEGDIRQKIIEADLVDCVVAMPPQLFLTTGIPVCLWFVTRDKSGTKCFEKPAGRDRSGETLFIDAREMGTMETRTLRVLSGRDEYPIPRDSDIGKIARTYHAWRGEPDAGEYEDVPGYCKASKLDEIEKHGYVLTPGRYVGATEVEDDGIPLADKMAVLTKELSKCFAESDLLQAEIRQNLASLGFPLETSDV